MANNILKSYIQTLVFTIYMLLIFMLCRIGFILNSGVKNSALLSTNENSVTFSDIITTLIAGFRYDGRIIGALALIFIVLYLLFFFIKSFRNGVIYVYSFLIIFIIIAATIVNDTYHTIFNDTFNIILLGTIYDDQKAIFQTAMNSDYNVILKVSLIFLFSIISFVLYLLIFKKIEKKEFKSKLSINIISGIILLYSLLLLTASSFNLKGGDVNYLIRLPENNFLKKVSPGAIHDLDRVNRAYSSIKGESFERYSKNKTIQQVLKEYFGSDYKDQDNITLLMEKEVVEGTKNSADHIFFIVMESLSEYHFSDEFRKAGISESLFSLIESKDGLKMPVFIQNGYGTIETLDFLITGLYGTYFPTSERTGNIPCFDSSTGKIFKNLGYDTSFYYFGSSAWRKIGTYTLSQGFNQSYALENMKNRRKSTWGVYDNEGFDFIYEDIKNHKNKTFTMVMSTSNHPPYDINYKDFNIDIQKITSFLDSAYPKDKRHKTITPEILAVTTYSINSLTEFIKKTYEKYPNSLFVITGDHFDRIHPNPNRNLYQSTSIPLILYGKGVADIKFKYGAGSHMDIVPTIVEMNAPKGFKYHSFGSSLITYDKNMVVDNERIAIGAQSVGNTRFISNGETLYYFDNATKKESDDEVANKYIQKRNNGQALSYYIVNKGYNIK